MTGLLRDFKEFVLRGNVIDLAVGFVIGVAFSAVVAALVKDLATPLIAAVFGKPDFAALSFTINGSEFDYGDFIDALITFLTVAAAMFFLVVKPIAALSAARARGHIEPDATTRPCSECLSEIPVAATRCAYCTRPQPTATALSQS